MNSSARGQIRDSAGIPELPLQVEHDLQQAAAAGRAALTLMEALLLILHDKQLIEEHEIDAMFEVAISAHEHRADTGKERRVHWNVAALLRRLHAHGNTVRSV